MAEVRKDVEALPVVAYGYANTRPTEKSRLMMVQLDNRGDQYPELALPLVLQSDALAALAEAEQRAEAAEADARRYRDLKPRLLAADFAWGEPQTPVIVFKWDGPVSGNLDAMLDDLSKEASRT